MINNAVIAHILSQSDEVFGQNEDNLATQQEVDALTGMVYAQITDDKKFFNRADAHMPVVTVPPMDQEWDRLLRTLKRSPTDWEPRSITLLDVSGQEVVPRQFGRDSITVYNASATVTLARNPRDFTGSRVIPLIAGASITIKTEGPLWAIAPIGTTFNAILTWWNNLDLAEAKEDMPVKNMDLLDKATELI